MAFWNKKDKPKDPKKRPQKKGDVPKKRKGLLPEAVDRIKKRRQMLDNI